MFKVPHKVSPQNGLESENCQLFVRQDEPEDAPERPYLTLTDIWHLPPKEWTLQNWFGRQEIGIIFGDSASGKTFVAIELMVCAMLDKRLAKQFDFSERMKCLYVCGEGFSGAIDRIKARLSQQRLPSDINEYFFVQREVPNLSDSHAVEAFVKAHKDLDIGIVVIDTLNIACYGANENDASAMGVVFKNAQKIAQALNATVVMLHHANKSNGGYRGSTAIRASCDFAIKVDNTKKIRTIECDKLKDGEQWDKISFVLKGVDSPTGGRSAIISWDVEESENFTPKDAIAEYFKLHGNEWMTYKEANTALTNENAEIKITLETFRTYCNELAQENVLVEALEKDIRNNGANYQSKVYQYNAAIIAF